MNEDYLTSPFNDDMIRVMREISKSLESFKVISESLAKIDLTPLYKSIDILRPVLHNGSLNESVNIVAKSLSSLNSYNLKELNIVMKAFYSEKFFESFDIQLQSINKLNSELFRTKPIVDYDDLFDVPNETIKPPETPVQSDDIKDITSEIKKRMYDFNHNIIAPFRNKVELANWITYYIIQNILENNHVPVQIKVIIVFAIVYQLSSEKN